ncbi:hypothetical protein L873DRAFT_1244215 [Choiromyces venosus 120613-1]|uniref:Uncharacterized protein n=1 Tax=Choiromyces venosus 120613-1 TaxID=1336337 RepID=A0A3N4JR42_9PEZI|nr:hypothetical protein L873DRAFT_1244215 [Choiromyces venosus 120613-1]
MVCYEMVLGVDGDLMVCGWLVGGGFGILMWFLGNCCKLAPNLTGWNIAIVSVASFIHSHTVSNSPSISTIHIQYLRTESRVECSRNNTPANYRVSGWLVMCWLFAEDFVRMREIIQLLGAVVVRGTCTGGYVFVQDWDYFAVNNPCLVQKHIPWCLYCS